ncbi:MAG: tandem-95 repeat protein, partial [Gammaproteobacteria bacterium]|nr:tandem-95 repeat protein [Gammaproteobacteria bacterium]
ANSQLNDPSAESGLVSYYNFNAVDGDEVADLVGNNTLVIHNGASVDAAYNASTPATVDENAVTATVVATLSTTDVDAVDSHSYTLIDDTSGFFEIVGNEVRVRENADIDFEIDASHEITILSTDSEGNEYSEVVTIAVNDINEAPTDIVFSASGVDENSVAGTVVATLSTVDEDAGETFSYALTDTSGLFEITGNQIVVRAGADIDFETAISHDVSVQVTDAGGNIYTENFTIDVNDLVENLAPDAVDDIADVFTPETATLTAEFNFDNGIPAASVGTVVAENDGQVGSAADFSAAKVEATGLDLNGAAGAQTTVSMWIQANPSGGWEMLAASDRYDMVMLNGDIGFNTARGDLFGSDASELADGEWHHVVGVFTNGDISQNSIYIDGVEQVMSQIQGTPNNSVANIDSSNGSMYFGSWGANNNYRFSGSMDEVKVYDGALTGNDVNELYGFEANNLHWNGGSLSTQEDTVLTINPAELLVNDTDPDGDALTISSVQDGANGTVLLDAQGNIVFTPDADYNGEATFSYTVSDGNGGEDTATVTLNISSINDVPTIDVVNSITVDEDGSQQFIYSTSDIDSDSVTLTGSAENGTIVVNGNGTVTFTPNEDYFGNDTITLTATDNDGGITTQQITVTVNPIEDAPDAVDDGNFEPQNATLTAEFNFDGGVPSAIVGSVTVEGDGQIGSAADFSAAKVEASGLDLNSAAGAKTTVSMWIQANPEGGWEMLAASDRYDMVMLNGDIGFNTARGDMFGSDASELADGEWHHIVGVFTNGDITQNQIFIDGVEQAMSQIQGTPNNGAANIDSSNGSMFFGSWGANDNYRFSGSMDEVKVFDGVLSNQEINTLHNLEAANIKWDATTLTTDEDTALFIDPATLLANDLDVDGDTLSIVSVQDAENGVVMIDGDGNIIFTPDENYSGEANFTYTVDDGKGNTDTATVTLNVASVNDAPVAVDDETVSLIGTVLVSEDFENGATGWTDNTVTESSGNATDFLGQFGGTGGNEGVSKAFDFGVEHAGETVTIEFDMYEIDSWDDEQFKVFINGDEVSSDYLSHFGRTWSTEATDEQDGGTELDAIGSSGQYWLDHDESHHYSLEATVDESGLVQLGFGSTLNQSISDESWGIDNLTITAGNDWTGSAIETNEDVSLIINVSDLLSNDVDVDGDTLTLLSVSATDETHGSVILNGDGTISYTPVADYNGTASFTYSVSDGQGGSDTATVSLNVVSVNDSPTDITLLGSSVDENSAAGTVVAILSTADVDTNETFTYTLTDNSGLFEISGDQIVVKAGADIDFENAETHDISVQVTDSNGETYSENFTINVNDINENISPNVVDDTTMESTFTLPSGGRIVSIENDGATVAGAIVSEGEALSSVDQWSFNHKGGPLIIDVLTESGDSFIDIDGDGAKDHVDSMIRLYDSNGNLVIVNDDSALGTADGSTNDFYSHIQDSYISIDDLPAGEYQLAVGSWELTDAEVAADQNDNSDKGRGYNIEQDLGPYQIKFTGDISFETVADLTTDEDSSLVIDVLAYDNDPDGDPLIITDPGIATDADGNVVGSTEVVEVEGSQQIRFTPNAVLNAMAEGEREVITFSYTVSDGNGGIEQASVSITVTGNNDSISAVVDSDDSANSVAENIAIGSYTGITLEAIDADGDAVTYTIDADVPFIVDENGRVLTSEALDFESTESYTFEATATSTDGTTSTSSFTVNVSDIEESTEIRGTWRSETINGTDNNDVIYGEGGNDIINAGDGNDVLIGGRGNDVLMGGEGDDTFIQNAGDGYDVILGGEGNDRVVRGSGDGDIGITGNFDATNSIESIDAGGNDIAGDWRSQTLDFSDTNLENVDEIRGEGGNDTITGTSSDDTIVGGRGNDVLMGGEGDDTFIQNAGDGYDVILGGEGNDRVVRGSGDGDIGITGNFDSTNSIETIDAGGNDIAGDWRSQTLDFSDTNLENVDEIRGEGGHDRVIGSAGDDTISGGAGNDHLTGGTGDDVLIGGSGNDSAFGAGGNDTYVMDLLGGSDYFSGGDGGGWTDAIDVSEMTVIDPDNPWTIEVDGAQVEYDLAAGALAMNPDTVGVITFGDGSELSFDGVERIEW